jgi:hypothetical protein
MSVFLHRTIFALVWGNSTGRGRGAKSQQKAAALFMHNDVRKRKEEESMAKLRKPILSAMVWAEISDLLPGNGHYCIATLDAQVARPLCVFPQRNNLIAPTLSLQGPKNPANESIVMHCVVAAGHETGTAGRVAGGTGFAINHR